MTDQHRADHTGFGGSAVVATPNLDRLASEGVVFDQAYVANPLCQPNRSSILTGRYPSVHGTRHNGIALDWRANTFVKRLRASGYVTALIGKSHFQNFEVHPDLAREAFDFTLDEQAVLNELPEGWDSYESLARHRAGAVEYPDDYYGFAHVEIASDHGDRVVGDYLRWLEGKGVDWRGEWFAENAAIVSPTWDQIRKPALGEELYPTTWVTERTIDLIENQADEASPWFIQCSYPDPHHPFTPPGKYYDMYSPGDVELPSTFLDDHASSMPHFRRIVGERGNLNGSVMLQSPNEAQLRAATAAQFGAISMIDDGVGRVLAGLERTGQADNTVVIFTSDHGDMMGDHGLLLKMFAHYDGCIRVPLIIKEPGVTPARSDALNNSLDVPSTILDLCDVDGYHGMQGLSLKPILDDPTVELRDHLLIEEDQIRDPLQAGVQPRMRSVVTKEARVTRYQNLEQAELYDRGDDPDELVNLWDDARGSSLRRDMSDLLIETMIACANPSYRPDFLA